MRVMISHSAKDKLIAESISKIIRKISLSGIEVWFSSDDTGGIASGSWFEKIISELNQADLLVVLLTENSLSSRWVLFETGYVSSRGLTNVLPITCGVNLDNIGLPLSYFEIYDLLNESRRTKFLATILDACDTKFDSEAFGPFVIEESKKILDHVNNSSIHHSTPVKTDLDRVIAYIDQKFSSLEPSTEAVIETFSVEVRKLMSGNGYVNHYIEIDGATLISDFLDEVYYKFQLRSFTYLEKWILVESATKRRFVIREFTSRIKAQAILRKGMVFELLTLDVPYSGADSHMNEVLLYQEPVER